MSIPVYTTAISISQRAECYNQYISQQLHLFTTFSYFSFDPEEILNLTIVCYYCIKLNFVGKNIVDLVWNEGVFDLEDFSLMMEY